MDEHQTLRQALERYETSLTSPTASDWELRSRKSRCSCAGREVREKIAELERSGELASRIEKAAAKAVPEEPPDDARPE